MKMAESYPKGHKTQTENKRNCYVRPNYWVELQSSHDDKREKFQPQSLYELWYSTSNLSPIVHNLGYPTLTPKFVRTMVFNPKVRSDSASPGVSDRTMGLKFFIPKVRTNHSVQLQSSVR